MESLQKRIDSFSKARRVKNPAKPLSSVTVKWTHPVDPQFIATPTTLAQAGFYFNPSFEERDNVACFVCDKQLAYWEAEDDPFDIHWEKCGDNCCWAMLRCGLREDMDRHGGFVFTEKSRLPTSKAIEKARLKTFSFGDGWIHDQAKNHGANSRKMARAGFVFTPTEPGDDLVTCLYCSIALSGWEPDDDPTEEHRKRQKSGIPCPMFSLPDAASNPPSRSTSQSQLIKPPSRSQSQQSIKASRPASSSKHKDMIMPMKTYDGGGIDADESDTPPSPSSRYSTATKGRATSGASKSTKTPKRNRSQSRSGLRNAAKGEDGADGAQDQLTAEENESLAPAGRTGRAKAKKNTTAKAKGRPRSKSVAKELVKDEEEEVVEEEIVEKPVQRSRSKAKDKKKAVAVVTDTEEEADEVQVLKKSVRGKALLKNALEPESEGVEENQTLKKSTRGKAVPPPPHVTESEINGAVALKKSTRGRPASRAVEEAANLIPRKASKTKEGKAPTIFESEDEPEVVVEEVVDEGRKPRQTSRSKPKTPPPRKPSRAKSKAKIPAVELEDEGEDEPAPPPPVADKMGKQRVPSSKPSSSVVKATASISKAKGRTRPPQDDVGPNVFDDEDDDDDEMDVFHSLQPSPEPLPNKQPLQPKKGPVKQKEMEPLFIPKRGAKLTMPATVDTRMDVDTKGPRKTETEKMVAHESSVLAAGKAKETKEVAKGGKRKVSNLKVVEISTDEDDVPEEPKRNSKTIEARRPKGPSLPNERTPAAEAAPAEAQEHKKPSLPKQWAGTLDIATVSSTTPVITQTMSKPTSAQKPQLSLPSPPRPTPSQDTEMASTEPDAEPEPWIETQPAEEEEPPLASPRLAPPTLPDIPTPLPEPASLPLPPLSKLPFTPAQSLTEAELDMTVEEWIRYQMEVEYDKFRRDGEREIGRFKKRAEEVRGIIEGL